MKKVDKVIITSFLGPFVLTMLVVIFILLTQHMLKYFDDLVGKDLDWDVLVRLIGYFAIYVTPFAFPLGVLLSSLMTFGNLGEHSELTAIKSGGISLPRTMRSIFIFVIFLSGVAFLSNNYLVPKAALEAYSLMWDIKRKKPAMEIPEGEFYAGIPDFRIRVGKKFKDSDLLKDVIIYDHTSKAGNKEVTLADSGRMTTIMSERYLKMELYNGYTYSEGSANNSRVNRKNMQIRESFTKIKFQKSEMVLDLASFDLKRTDKDLFSRNRLMRNINELDVDIDSVQFKIKDKQLEFFYGHNSYFDHHLLYNKNMPELPLFLQKHQDVKDSLAEIKRILIEEQKLKDSLENANLKNIDSLSEQPLTANDPALSMPTAKRKRAKPPTKDRASRNPTPSRQNTKELTKEDSLAIVDLITTLEADSGNYDMVLETALQKARESKNRISGNAKYVEVAKFETRVFEIQYHKIIANALACIVMFLIGAPLGSIIKKGGLGVPVLISILFFIIYYVLIMIGEKWAKNGIIYSWAGIWSANFVLFPVGLFFMEQARKDVRLFEVDFYSVMFLKLKKLFNRKGEDK